MAITFVKAKKEKSKLRLGLAGPAGSGKTYSALKIALGMVKPEEIYFIDSERGSARLYANLAKAHGGEFNVCELDGDFSPDVYTQAIHAAEQNGAKVIIVDSLTHAWSGAGGALDMVNSVNEKAAARGDKANTYFAWRQVTPKHNNLVDSVLQSPCHIIATLRVKTEYEIVEDERGKKVPRKIGLAPIQRDGMEYEFTAFLDITHDHKAIASKDRLDLFKDKLWTLDESVGKMLNDWLEDGEVPSEKPKPIVQNKPIVTDGGASEMMDAVQRKAVSNPLTTVVEWTKKIHDCKTMDELMALSGSISTMPEDIKAQLRSEFKDKKEMLGVSK